MAAMATANPKSASCLLRETLPKAGSRIPDPDPHLTPCINLLISGAMRNSSTPAPSSSQKPVV